MSFSSANVINSLYTGCDKDKKQTSPKKDEEIVELLKKLKKLESEQKESDAKFQAYVKTSNEQQRTIEEKYKNQIAALQKEVLDLKTRLDTEQKRNLELSQKLTDAQSFAKRSAKENDTDDARIDELLSELEMTREELRESQSANQVAFDSIEKFDEFVKKMQQSPQGVNVKAPTLAEVNSISAVLHSDAVFQSKRQKAGSLFGQFFSDLLKYAKAFGEGKRTSAGIESIRNANNNIFPRIEKTVNSIQKYFPQTVYGDRLAILANTYRDYLRAYSEFLDKSKSRVDADQIAKIVDEDDFPTKHSVSDAFLDKHKQFVKEASALVAPLQTIFYTVRAMHEAVEKNKKEEDLNIERTIDKAWTSILSEVVFYGAAQLSGDGNDLTAAVKSKENIIADAKTFGIDLYVGVTGSTDRSLLERFNPFKDKKEDTKSTVSSTKPTNAKVKFRVINL
jgi:hypothetical protein